MVNRDEEEISNDKSENKEKSFLNFDVFITSNP